MAARRGSRPPRACPPTSTGPTWRSAARWRSQGSLASVPPRPSCHPTRKQAQGAEGEDREEYEVAAQDRERGVDLGADRLRHAEHHAAQQRAPQRAEATDDHRLEGEEES